MRDTCGLLIAGQGAARGDRRATGELEVRGAARAETRFHFRTGIASVVPWLVG